MNAPLPAPTNEPSWFQRLSRAGLAVLPCVVRQPGRCPPFRRFAFETLRLAIVVLGVALFIVTFENDAFWTRVLRATDADDHQVAIIATLFAIQFCPLVLVLALSFGRSLKIAAAALLVVSAGAGFFMNDYGIVIDESMVRNVMETNAREATPLLTGALLFHLIFFGLIPAGVVAVFPLAGVGWRAELTARSLVAFASVILVVVLVRANYGAVSYFAHEQHQARLLMNPGYPLYASVRYAFDAAVPSAVAAPSALDVRRSPAAPVTARPRVLIFVVGETARADRFSWNGYERDTNRYTRALDVINFPHVSSCGTSTADSVPCMFTPFGHAGFSHAAFASTESLFGALQRLGIAAAWRDNSTGCKGVCDPEHFVELAGERDPSRCDATGCFDEILLRDLENELDDRTKDHFIVLHQRGSHGPAYFTDTPAWIKTFEPECDLANLRNCTSSAINNAYDNTILYTDYFLAKVVEFLRTQGDVYDVAMLYVSDHGESLGENGIYLHGFPYAIAPPEQVRVPMLFWASPTFYAHRAIDAACVDRIRDAEYSHDYVFHTLLSLLDVEIAPPRHDLDLFAPCRDSTRSNVSAAGETRGGPA